MDEKICCFGYDLGDGETIIDAVTTDENLNVQEIPGLRMPDSVKEGEPIPTGFGYDQDNKVFLIPSILQCPEITADVHAYFKRKPTGLMGTLSDVRYDELTGLFKKGGWPSETSCPEVYSEEFVRLVKNIQTFTEAIFSDPEFQESAKFASVNCNEFVFCVGYPTKWNELDRLIYWAILKRSILGTGTYLGKRASLIVERESRAAYLYVLDKARPDHSGESALPEDTCSVLLDIGSSTVDVTAVTAGECKVQYNSGNNYLGARGIDFLIRDWYLEQLRPDDRMRYEALLKTSSAMKEVLALACRSAKEQAYSTRMGIGKVLFETITPMLLTQDKVDELANNVPVAQVLREAAGLPESESRKWGDKSWVALLSCSYMKELCYPNPSDVPCPGIFKSQFKIIIADVDFRDSGSMKILCEYQSMA